MSKPESVKIDPWVDFPKQPYSLITDDFVHDKLASVKVNAKGEKSSANLKLTAKEHKQGVAIDDQAKVWFALKDGRTIFTRVKSTDQIKVHYDNGITQHWGRSWNLYASFNTSKSLNNLSVRIGAHSFSERVNSDNRLKFDYSADGSPSTTWYNRTVFAQNKLTFGVLAAVGLSRKVLAKNNIFLGYKIDDNSSVSLRAENEGYRKDPLDLKKIASQPLYLFDHIKLDYIRKVDDIKVGVEGIFRTNGNVFKEVLVVGQHQNKAKNITTKVRLSSSANISALIKFPSILFKDIATTSVGLHAAKGEKKGSPPSFKYGVQLEFNI